ncbi:TetR/AcrR family transcriptional regulator [Kribbella soli]|uniref:TetR/AcrR family transcriptional regulator n=1 Tax=Kribbella soli TaxID=1124743 RepID=A0A4R0H8G8_9ACTN|nr:TetR family transcriptional regulator [Kribbella soli]TCC03959.1 TetR/AcrR family transcriptional regulator [Kribbella soli]
MPRRSSRRTEICDAALTLAAEGGNHALTHQKIDKELGIAQGSTSYYFRTREQLVEAAIRHLTEVTRDAFATAQDERRVAEVTTATAAAFMAKYVDTLLGPRRRDALARYALSPDAIDDEELRNALAVCLFGLEPATELMKSLGAPRPARAARDLLSLLEGLLFDRLYGARAAITPGTRASLNDLRRPIALWLEALRNET